jgi:hypothetical protein
MEEQLSFDVPGEASPTPEFLTIAEPHSRSAAASARSAEQSTAARCGRAGSTPSTADAAAFGFAPADLESWMYGDGP